MDYLNNLIGGNDQPVQPPVQQPAAQPQQAYQPSNYAPVSQSDLLALQNQCAAILRMDMSKMPSLFDIISRRGNLAFQVMQSPYSLTETDKATATSQLSQLNAALRDILGLP